MQQKDKLFNNNPSKKPIINKYNLILKSMLEQLNTLSLEDKNMENLEEKKQNTNEIIIITKHNEDLS